MESLLKEVRDKTQGKTSREVQRLLKSHHFDKRYRKLLIKLMQLNKKQDRIDWLIGKRFDREIRRFSKEKTKERIKLLAKRSKDVKFFNKMKKKHKYHRRNKK